MTASPASQAQGRLREIGIWRKFLNRPEFGSIIGAIVVYTFFVIVAGGKGFTSLKGIAGTLEIASQIGILGVTVSLLMIAGEFDLSIGSMVGASGLVFGFLVVEAGWPIWGAIIAAFAFALAVGAFNGYMVYRTGLPSFLVTLATLFILRGASIGLTRLLTNLTVISGIRDHTEGDPIAWLFNGILFSPEPGADFKISILWWLGLALVATWVLLRTKFGNWIFGTGGSAVAARNVGVPVARVKISLFMATAASACLLAMIQVMSAGSADVLRGQNKEFEAIITATIGGTLMTGGYGSALGSMFGAFTLGATQLGIVFAGINTDWYQVVLGVMLLVAVLVNNWTRRRASEARR
jgi:simple sugar transport system permease protein